MKRALAIVAGLVALLLAADRWLAAREARALAAGGRVGALFTPEEAERLTRQPALRIELSGEAHAYGRVQGQWRCLSYHQAPADGRAIQALLEDLAHAEGIVHSESVDEAPEFGINTPRTLRIAVQGPNAMKAPGGDVQATLEVGLAQAGRGGCFVRLRGTRAIWSIASDLRAPIEQRLGPGLPPLLAASVIPATFVGAGDLVGVTLERGGVRTRLERRERALDPATMKPGMLPWRWVIATQGPDEPEVPQAYVDFLEQLPYRAVLDPGQHETLVPVPPAARVTLEQAGARLELAFGADLGGGDLALWVEASGTLYRVAAETLALALPDEARLTTSEEPDPWSRALGAGRADLPPAEPR